MPADLPVTIAGRCGTGEPSWQDDYVGCYPWRMSDSNNCRPREPALLMPVDPPRSCVRWSPSCAVSPRDTNAKLSIEPGRFLRLLFGIPSGFPNAGPCLNRSYRLPPSHPFRPPGHRQDLLRHPTTSHAFSRVVRCFGAGKSQTRPLGDEGNHRETGPSCEYTTAIPQTQTFTRLK